MKVKLSAASNPTGKNIRPAKKLPVVHPHSAGIDVGATEHSVCVPEDAVSRLRRQAEELGCEIIQKEASA